MFKLSLCTICMQFGHIRKCAEFIGKKNNFHCYFNAINMGIIEQHIQSIVNCYDIWIQKLFKQISL